MKWHSEVSKREKNKGIVSYLLWSIDFYKDRVIEKHENSLKLCV